MNEIVSVIMSVYNEPIEILDESINSIINQTYKQVQFIIINDNPLRNELKKYLDDKSKNNNIIVVLQNQENIGLVKSLNRGISYATGKYIARMDADDISLPDRIYKQITFLNKNSYDMIGCSVIKIDELGNVAGKIVVPSSYDRIKKFYKFGSCMLHPTWLVKREVFDELNNYREIYACEDYDFVLRALKKGYLLGNSPEFLLKYRIRDNGISISSEAQQKLTMFFLNKNRENIDTISIESINDYLESDTYKKNREKLDKYIKIKNCFRNENIIMKKLFLLFRMMFNRYFYISLKLYIMRIVRNI